MDPNPYRPPTTALEDRAIDPPRGIRKGWAVLLGWYVLSLIVSVFQTVKFGGSPTPYQVVMWVLDAAVIYGLYEYVMRKPIRHPAVRLGYIALVLVIICRMGAALYLIRGAFWPWRGLDQQHAFALAILISLPFAVLTAYALWQHANQPPPQPRPVRQEPSVGGPA